MHSDKDMADATNVVQSIDHIFSRGHATLELAVSVRRYVGRSEILLNCERFSHYSSCPTVRDCIAVYPALFYFYSFIITVGSIIYDSILQIARFQSVHSNHPMGFTFFSYKNRISTER